MIPYLILLTLIFPFLFKYQYLITNQFTQIPIIKSIFNPYYLINDWYVNINRHFGPRTIFAFYMACLSKIFSLPWVFFLNYLLYIFLIVWSAFHISQILFRDKIISLLTTVFILFGTTYTLGGNILITRDFSAPQLPLAFIITALTLLIKEKIYLSLLFMVLATYLHPLIGWEGSGLILISWSFYYLFFKKQKLGLTRLLRIWGIYALLIMPLFLSYFSELSVEKSGVNQQILINILAYSRHPHHYVASTWLPQVYIRYFIFLLVAFLIGKKIYSGATQKVKNIIKLFLSFSILVIVSNLLGFFFTEIWSLYQIVIAQLFRNNLMVYFLGAIIVYGGIMTLVKSQRLSPIFLPILFLFNQPNFSLRGKTDWLALIFILIFFGFFQRKRFVISSIFLLVIFYLLNYHTPFSFSSSASINPQVLKLTEWIKINTPSNSVFIIPPQMEEFRLLAERAVVADWKGFPFQKIGIWMWYQRMCDLGNLKSCETGLISKEKIISGFLTLKEKDIENLQRKYLADYLISEVKFPSLKMIYAHDIYVYDLNSSK